MKYLIVPYKIIEKSDECTFTFIWRNVLVEQTRSSLRKQSSYVMYLWQQPRALYNLSDNDCRASGIQEVRSSLSGISFFISPAISIQYLFTWLYVLFLLLICAYIFLKKYRINTSIFFSRQYTKKFIVLKSYKHCGDSASCNFLMTPCDEFYQTSRTRHGFKA